MKTIPRPILAAISILFIAGFVENSNAQRSRQSDKTEYQETQQRRLDDPAEEESLNRELWEFARRIRYKSILPYVAAQQRKSKVNQHAEVELPNGWRIAPAGRQIEVGRLPYEVVPFAGKLVVLNTGYYRKEPQQISIVDPVAGKIENTLKVESLFPSAVVGLDGGLYLSGGFSQKILRLDERFNVRREYSVSGFAGGVAPIDSEHLAVTIMAVRRQKDPYLNGRLEILNTTSGEIERGIDLGYFPFTVRFIDNTLFVTLLGENKLLAFSRELKPVKTLQLGVTPQEMCSDGHMLYVVNTGSDSLSVVDARTSEMRSTIYVKTKGSTFGAAPSSCAVDAGRLYVTLANQNLVDVLDSSNGREIAQIPTGWYPTKVLVDKQLLIVTNAKGIHARRPNPDGPTAVAGSKATKYVLNLLTGSVGIIPLTQATGTLDAEADGTLAGQPEFDRKQALSLPIKHVFFVIKENRTYDQVLGDLPKGNGDPKLTIFGESVTPIEHQLAREFVTLDNLFVDGEISVLGHSFTTSGYASPFIEWFGNVSYSDKWKGDPFGTVPATF
jgi:YVTN family beta-propeller protein